MAVAFVNSILILLAFIILFNFGAYSVLLGVIARFRNVDHKIDPQHTPSVTLLIAAYNEGSVLKEKLQNSLAIDYPKDLLDIVVVSDGSSDNTDEIVQTFASRSVKLIVNQTNSGKATALNKGMDQIKSDIVVLSDANVMYQRNAIRKLVRHFADPVIGAVSGKVVLLNDGLSYSEAENTYYQVEHNIQQLESNTGNLIGADGAMYALRRDLFRPLLTDTLLDDFVISMGVIQQGHRLIFDPQALGFEQNRAEIDSEYKRKVRIVAGGIQSLKRKTVWPPHGHFLTALKFTCHKILRWIIGPVIVLFVVLSVLSGMLSGSYLLPTLVCGIALICPLLHTATQMFPALRQIRFINICNYLTVMIKASIVGCYKALTSQQVSWR